MEFKISDWIVNEGNVFEFNELEHHSISVIYYEINNQIEAYNITTVGRFLNWRINTTNEISLTKRLSIEKVINEYLFNEVISLPQLNEVDFLLRFLQLWLHRKFRLNASAPMYGLVQYKKHYERLKGYYFVQWLDADEADFINAQLALCDTLEVELQKPVYNELHLLGAAETPTKFKQELTLTIVKRRAYLNEKLNSLSTTIDALKPTETKADKLKFQLTTHGFFELPKVKLLSEPNKQNLVELIINNKMPYGIAMFNELGFCEFLDNEHGAKYKANKVLSRLYKEDAKDGTTARHYRHSLVNPNKRYNAKQYKEKVIKDYQNLK